MKFRFSINLLADIRFWLILFFLIRLIHITQPPLESSHNWRQSFTAMMARNFVEGNGNIFTPSVNYNGEKEGIVGAEFPVLSYSIALVSKLTGYQHWTGRLINLIVSTLGVYCFYLLVFQYFNRRMALFSAILLMMSVWLMFSRKIMPDTFSVSLALFSLYFGVNYLKRGKIHHLILFFVFGTLGVLAKMPAAIILSLLVPLVFSKIYQKKYRIILFAGGTLILVLLFFWYFYYVPFLVKTYGNQLFFTRTLSEGLRDIRLFGSDLFNKFSFAAFQGYLGFVAFLAGLILAVIRKQKKILFVFLVSYVFLLVYVVKTGYVFATHSYYIIPFVPVMALIAGYALSEIKPVWIGALLLIIVSAESFANQQHDVNINENEKIKLRYEIIADKYIPKESLVLTNGDMNPQQIYFINRKGWTVTNEELSNKELVNSLKNRGLEFVFLNTCSKGTPDMLNEVVYKEKCIKLYRLD